MAAPKKIVFESFETPDVVEEEIIVEEIEEIVEQIEEPEEVIPTFGEEQVAAAREEGITVGREMERAEMTETIERQTMETLASVEKCLGELFHIQEHANEETHLHGLAVATTIVRRMFPSLNQEHGQREVENMVASVMEMVIDEPRIAVHVNEKVHPSLEKQINTLTAKKGFEGKLILSSDENIPLGDCKIEWGKGSAVRDMDAWWREVDKIIERNLGGNDIQTAAAQEEMTSKNTKLEVTGNELPNVETDSADRELTNETKDSQPAT